MGGMAGVGVAPPPNHPPTSLAGGSTRARHPGPSIARARCGGNAILGAFRCRSPPSHPTPPPPDNPLQTAPSLFARYDDARAKPTHARALRRRRRSLARSTARAVCGGSDGVRLHRPSRALRAPRVTRAHAHVIAAHRARRHRFPFPLHARMRALRAATALARSLARSLARVRCGVGGGGGVQLHRASRASRARACTSSPRIARVITAPLPRRHPYARAAAAAALSRLLACSRARRRRRWGWGRRSVTSRVTRVKHVTCVARHARARAYHHRFARVITVFRPPRARPARARCCGGGARSLARARAVWRWRWRWRSVTPRITRVTRVTRARVHVITAHRARHHRPPSPMSPMRARGSGGGAVSFARLLARAEAEADGHSHVVRVSRVTRARARVIIVTALVSATPIEVRSFRRRLVFSSLFSLVFSFFVSPRAHYDETTGDM